MKSLTITLCLLIQATVIIAKTVRLPSAVNQLKFYAKTNTPIMVYTTPIPWHYTPRPNKFLYNYNYNTDTGIQAQEHGHLNNVGTDQEAIEVRGSYSYTDNEGKTYQVSYVANENGFQPEGAHLPEVPPLIKKALQYIAEHPEENGE
ncbi:larval cuticle protein LCP-17-like [Cataglyphis hispanica]|uniref:larval cuticle protein LCP-17-like n=1 Tax=Cataglyphis hispanica TaxID=1086592 RepID=UPI00218037C7|nr:larval cuticle protein LCP-17-like [Cataglyphis hispanica]